MNLWYLGIALLVAIALALAVAVWVVGQLTQVWLKLRGVEDAQQRLFGRTNTLEGYREEHRTRIEALERRPPVVNVSCQALPKQGAAK